MAVLTIADWIRPSPLNVETQKYIGRNSGAKDALETAINIFDWMGYLGIKENFAKNASTNLNVPKSGLSAPSFLSHINDVRRGWKKWRKSDDPKAGEKLFQSTMLMLNSGSDTAMFLDSIRVVVLKGAMQTVKFLFWTPLFLFDVRNFYRGICEVEELEKQKAKTINIGVKNILDHKINLTYMNILKSATTIAMASLALISLIFASMAHYFIFSTVVFLTLTSTWLSLNFATFAYDKMIGQWEKALPGEKV